MFNDGLIEVVSDAERAHTLFHPARLHILQALKEPSSSAALAKKLDLPRQRVNYHLRELENQKLVELKEEKVKGSVKERIYQRKGSTFAISPAVFGKMQVEANDIQDKFSSSYQIARASQVIDELHQLQHGANQAQQKLPTLSIDVDVRFASAKDRNDFSAELTETIQSLVEKYQDNKASNGRWFKFYAGAYPKIKSPKIKIPKPK